MRILKGLSLALLVLLGICFCSALLLGGFMPLFCIAFGILFLYYLVIYIIVSICQESESRILTYLVYLFFFLPIIWAVLDVEGLTNFLMQGVHLDMR